MTIWECNIKEDTTLEMKGGVKNDDSMTSTGIAEDRQVKRNHQSHAGVKLSDVTAHRESASRRSDAKVDDMIQRMETMMHKTSELVLE